MAKKEKVFIMRNGQVTSCPLNVAKMNVFEYIYHIDKFRSLDSSCSYFIDFAKNAFNFVGSFFGLMIIIIFFPLIPFSRAYFSIKEARQYIAQEEQHKPKTERN